MNRGSALFRPLLKPEEAIILTKYRTIIEWDLIEDVAAAYTKKKPVPPSNASMDERRFYSMCFYQAIFTAGRIQGIREERARRRGMRA